MSSIQLASVGIHLRARLTSHKYLKLDAWSGFGTQLHYEATVNFWTEMAQTRR